MILLVIKNFLILLFFTIVPLLFSWHYKEKDFSIYLFIFGLLTSFYLFLYSIGCLFALVAQ